MKTELVVGDFETYWSDTHSLSTMTDAELEALAVKCGIYWVSEQTAYMHQDTMRAFADTLARLEREQCAKLCEAMSAKAGRVRSTVGSLEGDTGYECADAIRGA